MSILDSVIPIIAAFLYRAIVFNWSNFGIISVTFTCENYNPLISKKGFQKDWEMLFDLGAGFKFISPDNNKSI